jgi:hypothetical protein
MAPANAVEDFLLELMAQAQWKLNRMAEVEMQIFKAITGSYGEGNTPAAKIAFCLASHDNMTASIPKLNRYQAQAQRSYFQALNKLTQLQKERRLREAAEIQREKDLMSIQTDELLEQFLSPPPSTSPICRTNPIPANPLKVNSLPPSGHSTAASGAKSSA